MKHPFKTPRIKYLPSLLLEGFNKTTSNITSNSGHPGRPTRFPIMNHLFYTPKQHVISTFFVLFGTKNVHLASHHTEINHRTDQPPHRSTTKIHHSFCSADVYEPIYCLYLHTFLARATRTHTHLGVPTYRKSDHHQIHDSGISTHIYVCISIGVPRYTSPQKTVHLMDGREATHPQQCPTYYLLPQTRHILPT